MKLDCRMHRCSMILLAGAVLTTQAAAQSPRAPARWELHATDQLRRAGAALEAQGYHRRTDPMLGSLNQGQTDSLWVGLREGVEYALVGVCDSACTVNLRLFDNAGHEMAVAIGSGAPVLHITPPRNVKYRLRAVMAACGQPPCRYGVGLFER